MRVTVADVNEPPEFDSATATREVPENTEAGENIGAPVTANDPDTGDTPAYTLGGTDANIFDIGMYRPASCRPGPRWTTRPSPATQ